MTRNTCTLDEAIAAWQALDAADRADAIELMTAEHECWEDDGMWAPEALLFAKRRYRLFGVVLDILRAAAVPESHATSHDGGSSSHDAAEPEAKCKRCNDVGSIPWEYEGQRFDIVSCPDCTAEPEAKATSTIGNTVDASEPPVGSQELRIPFGCGCPGANVIGHHEPGCEHRKMLPLPCRARIDGEPCVAVHDENGARCFDCGRSMP